MHKRKKKIIINIKLLFDNRENIKKNKTPYLKMNLIRLLIEFINQSLYYYICILNYILLTCRFTNASFLTYFL